MYGFGSLKRVWLQVALPTVAVLAVAGPAQAATPSLLFVDHDGLHPTALFAARGADDVTVHIASSPDRATDGRFLAENSVRTDYLTSGEIASGKWMDADNLEPGTYFVMLQADTYSCPEGTDCIDGYSKVLELTILEPEQTFTASKRGGEIGSFTLTITPAGEPVPYKLCWTRGAKGRKCKRGVVEGSSWTRAASDTLYLSADDLKLPGRLRTSTLRWYVAGERVATKKIRLVPV